MLNNKHLEEKVIWHNLIDSKLITSNQVDCLIDKVKTEHSKIKELTKAQLKQHKAKLDNINKLIAKESKLIITLDKNLGKLKNELLVFKKLNNIAKTKKSYFKIAKANKSIKKKQLVINFKYIRVSRLNKSIY